MLLRILMFVIVVLIAPASAAVAEPPQIEWTLTNAPGIHFALQEVTRATMGGHQDVCYRAQTDGLPLGDTYWLYQHWIEDRTVAMPETFQLDGQGILFQDQPGDFYVCLNRMVRGEPMGFALVSRETEAKAFVQVIPFPLQAEGEGGCWIQMTLVTHLGGGSFLLHASGFEPGEEVRVVSKSGREVVSTWPALENGTVDQMIQPAVAGKKGGQASVTVSGQACTASLVYDWGQAMKLQ